MFWRAKRKGSLNSFSPPVVTFAFLTKVTVSVKEKNNWKDQKSCSKVFGSFSYKDLGKVRTKLKMKIFTTFVLKKGVRCKKEESVEHKGGKWLKGEKRTGERRQ